MGFLDKIKKSFGYKKEDIEFQNNVKDVIIDKSELIEILDDENILNEKEKIQFNDSEETPAHDEMVDKPPQIRNFKYLDDLIHSEVKEIVLDSDIILDSDEESQYLEGIRLDVDDLVIDGNGWAIDAKGKTRIFEVTGRNITIKNLTLKNGHAFGGGAIKNDNGQLTVYGSTFEGNIARFGGAINNEKGVLKVYGSTFAGNMAHDAGGAIMNFLGELSVVDSTLQGNTAEKHSGGAINNDYGQFTVYGSTFAGNIAKDSGGAIFNTDCELSVHESMFAGNTAEKHSGGAICHLRGELTITDSTLTENTSQWGGGAISITNYVPESTIIGSTFARNAAQKWGGAIDNSGELTISDSTLQGNTAKDDGGAIYNNDGELTVYGSTLKNNVANCGGAICTGNDKLTIWDSFFAENIANKNGVDIFNSGRIYCKEDISKRIQIHNNDFGKFYQLKSLKNNQKDFNHINELIHSETNEIKLENDIILNIEKNEQKTFRNGIKIDVDNLIIDGNGHMIDAQRLTRIFHCTGKNITIKNIILKNGFTEKSGGAINHKEGELTVCAATFAENTAQGDGGAINKENGELAVYGSTFAENTAQGDGGAINKENGELTVYGSTFVENAAQHHGGAIKNISSELTVYGSTFAENAAQGDGGAINNEAYLTINDCLLNNNNGAGKGGAIVNKGTSDIGDCFFKENLAKCGGGIFNDRYLTIDNSNFEKNTSSSQKHAQDIYNDGTITFKAHNFGNSTKSIVNENIMYLNENDVNITRKIVNNGIFYDNSPLSENQYDFSYLKNLIHKDHEIILQGDIILDTYNGEEAIFPDGILIDEDNIVIDGNGHTIDAKGKTRVFKVSGKNVVLKNVIIQNGYVFGNGAGIYNDSGDLVIEESYLINNTADAGAGIYNDSGNLVINESYLINNNAAKWSGGALYSTGGEIRIEKTMFDHNIAGSSGGAIDASLKNGFGVIDCINSIFKNNSADSGGAISNSQIKIEIIGCEFINNQCEYRGLNISQFYNKFGQKHDESSILLIENSLFYNDLNDEKHSIYISDGRCSCRKSKFQFKNEDFNALIYNEGFLRLDKPIFEDLNNSTNPNFGKVIYNNNSLKIFKKDNLEDFIESGPDSDISYLDSDFLSSSGNFTHLSKILKDNACSNEIILNEDFVLEPPEQDFFEGGIELDHQNLILDGQGHTISANGLSRIFLITGDDITLKNIKFENGLSYKSTFNTDLVNGGAINVLCNSSLKIVNCEFSNNISQISAGAIVNKGDLTMENTKFFNNVAESAGGSIYNYKKSSLLISNCEFANNESFNGGALFNEGVCIIKDSNHKANKSKNGGVIYNLGELNCDDSIFEYNKSSEFRTSRCWMGGNGGAIYSLNDSYLILKNTEFKGNNSTDGGAICVEGNFSDIERQKCDIDNCNFLQNYSERGGAINNDLNLTISDCNFKDNTLKIIYNDYGDSSEECDLSGASILNGKMGKVIVNNSNFEGSRQDIIRNNGTISLKKCQFEDNHEINGFKVSIYENEKDDWWNGIKFIK